MFLALLRGFIQTSAFMSEVFICVPLGVLLANQCHVDSPRWMAYFHVNRPYICPFSAVWASIRGDVNIHKQIDICASWNGGNVKRDTFEPSCVACGYHMTFFVADTQVTARVFRNWRPGLAGLKLACDLAHLHLIYSSLLPLNDQFWCLFKLMRENTGTLFDLETFFIFPYIHFYTTN